MFAAGVAGSVAASVAALVAATGVGALAIVAAWTAGVALLAAAYGLGMGAYMTYGSLVGKLHTRERLLDLAHEIVPWTGREHVLDVGCGSGLMLVGAARRLTTGKAVGIDVWRQEDQAGNGPGVALENARREGVADKVQIETGDARALPFRDGAFDVVVSHWVVHNLPTAEDRARCLDEMVRVLRTGGALVLADIANHETYGRRLAAAGLRDMREDTGGAASRAIGILSGGSFRPRAIVGRREAAQRVIEDGSDPHQPEAAGSTLKPDRDIRA